MKIRKIIFPVIFILILTFGMLLGGSGESYWGLISLALLTVVILEFFVLFEERVKSSKEVTLISILGVISAASRIPFAGIPSVQPSTFIVIVSGYVLGGYAGFMVGVETAFLSNLVLGQGPWTPWQMLAWGLAGLLASLLRKIRNTRHEWLILGAFGFVYAYLYGIIMNLWYWFAFIYPHTLLSFLMVESLSLYFDTLHALSNVIFIELFAPRMVRILERYRLRFSLG